MAYDVRLAPPAIEDLCELERSGYGRKARELLTVLEEEPLRNPPKYKKLSGDMKGKFSRRINAEHRLVYEVLPSKDEKYEGEVRVHRMRTHYKGIIPAIFFGSLIF
ncbi:Txe/YoeB family addiction module toxin [Candidatus Methanoplasma termitum]|uniref:Txe/YoeB family addiction module toxin n=1 Tax=Candidatus Methanoplasma termitum TaxID=1577791 RepID=UPI00064E8631|nr:Txe/YoeB family addiction module toxin [Candidatus Methanoplasma termitum]